MKFVVTSVASDESAEALRVHTAALDALLNVAVRGVDFSSAIDQVTLVVVAVDDNPSENAAWAKQHDRLGAFTHPISNERIRYLSISAQVSPSRIASATPEAALAQISRALETALGMRPKRLPRGFPFQLLTHVVSAALAPWSGAVA